MTHKMRLALCTAFIFSLMLGLSYFYSRRAVAAQGEQAQSQPPTPPTVEARQQRHTRVAAARDVSPESTLVIRNNMAAIAINDNTTAGLYPSQITVSGVNPALVTNVRVTLSQMFHTFPDDVDILLVGPQGQRAVLMSDAGGGGDFLNQSLVFDRNAATILPDSTQLTGGQFRPANYEALTDNFPAPGPGTLNALEPADLSVFIGTDPNGVWSLYVVDDATDDTGTILGGWNLSLTVPTVFTVTKTADTNDGVCDADCSLREALAAQNGDLINFSSLFNTP